MQTKYILFQKNSFSYFTENKIEHFFLEDFIEKDKKVSSASSLENYKKQLPYIVEKFIEQAQFLATDNIVLLFDHPWIQKVFLTMPWISQRKLQKITPFEVQKKSWLENTILQQNFYVLGDKKNKTKRVIVYGIEKYLVTFFRGLFTKKKLNLYAIESYTHWMEQAIYQKLIAPKKQKTPQLVVSFTTDYATGFLYDKLGLKAIYTLPVKQQKANKKFWDSFFVLLKRISLKYESFDVFYQKKEKYYLLTSRIPSSFVVENLINHQELITQSRQIRLQKKQLNLYQDQFSWNFSQWTANKNFLKKWAEQRIFFIRNLKFYRYLPQLRFFTLAASIVCFMSVLFALEYQETKQEQKMLLDNYHNYLKSYQLQQQLDQELVIQKLSEKTNEWKNLQEVQKNYLKNDYKLSTFLLQINKLSKKIQGMQIIELNLEYERFQFRAKGDQETFSQSKKVFEKNFRVSIAKYLGNGVFYIELKKK